MLRKLSIQNYAIIESLEVRFSPRLNIITGETGAGKSILVGALGLVLGDRADTSVSYQKDQKCVVEALFDAGQKKEVMDFLREEELDLEDELVLRREISASGKSRAFINDTPVTLAQLKTLSALLVDLHQQFDTLELGESDFQRQVVDAMAGISADLIQYKKEYQHWQQCRREYLQLQEQQTAFNKEFDYNQFQFHELEEAGFKEQEIEEAESEIKVLENAEGIIQLLDKINHELKEGENPILSQLRSMQQQLHPYGEFLPRLPEIMGRLQSTYLELQDISSELQDLGNGMSLDPGRLDQLNERINLAYKLFKKHGVTDTAGLLRIQAELQEKLQAVLQISEQIQATEKEMKAAENRAQEWAKTISAHRKKQLKPLEEKVNKLLAQVGMPNARLKAALNPVALNPWGQDEIQFLFDANKSGQFLPVGKVASGGELSRLMLCIKSLVARSMDLPTLIFDEIDTGISGEAARQVGIIMKELAANRQLISITHQPQIAGKADAHFFVFKEIKGDTVKTGIRELSMDERITTIAKMLSGEKPTAAALENAREMVGN